MKQITRKLNIDVDSKNESEIIDLLLQEQLQGRDLASVLIPELGNTVQTDRTQDDGDLSLLPKPPVGRLKTGLTLISKDKDNDNDDTDNDDDNNNQVDNTDEISANKEIRLAQIKADVEMRRIDASVELERMRMRMEEMRIDRGHSQNNVSATSGLTSHNIQANLLPVFSEANVENFFDLFEDLAMINSWPMNVWS